MYIVDEPDGLKGNVIMGVERTLCIIGVQKVYATCYILKRDKAVDGAVYKDDHERGIAFFNLHIEEMADDKVYDMVKMEMMPSFLQFYFLLASDFTKPILEKYGFESTDPNVLMDLDEKKIEGLNEVIKQMEKYQNAKQRFQNLSFGMDNWG